MGNPLNSVLKYIDPIGNAAGNAISGPKGILSPKQAPGAPKYDPSKNPGTQLYAEPGGGPPGGSAPGTGIFGKPSTPAGYAPNPWEAAQPGGRTGVVGNGPSGPGGTLSAGGSAPTPGSTGLGGAAGGTPFTLPGIANILGTGAPSRSTGNQGMPPSGPAPSAPGGVWLGRGGSNSQSQALAQQMAIAQSLRGNPGLPPTRMRAM